MESFERKLMTFFGKVLTVVCCVSSGYLAYKFVKLGDPIALGFCVVMFLMSALCMLRVMADEIAAFLKGEE